MARYNGNNGFKKFQERYGPNNDLDENERYLKDLERYNERKKQEKLDQQKIKK